MTGWALTALILLGVGVVTIVVSRLPPRQALAAGTLAVAGGLALMRQFALALPVAVAGVALWRRAVAAGSRPSAGQQSEVRTDGLAMRLDHDSGEMDGEVLTGTYAGALLSELSGETLQALLDEFEAAGDDESQSLLLAYLERRGGRRDEERTQDRAWDGPAPGQPPMTPEEAYRVLGLEPGASLEEVRSAYHRLMRRVHPDLGGSGALAAMINAAKELLDPN